jgi:hypothetical protein
MNMSRTSTTNKEILPFSTISKTFFHIGWQVFNMHKITETTAHALWNTNIEKNKRQRSMSFVLSLTSPNSYCRQLASLKSVTGLETYRHVHCSSMKCSCSTLIQHRSAYDRTNAYWDHQRHVLHLVHNETRHESNVYWSWETIEYNIL